MTIPKEFETYSWDDYRSWSEEERWELIAGVAWSMSPAPSRMHQKISIELAKQFSVFLEGGKCEVYAAPFDVKLSPETEDEAPTVLQPDIVLCCDPQKLTDWGLQGPPDLVVEIVSPESGRKDRKEKFLLYERYGVSEYWIVDPDEEVVEIYRLDGGRFERIGAFGPEDKPGAPVLSGFECDLSRVFTVAKKGAV